MTLCTWELAQFQGEAIETGSANDSTNYGVSVKSSYRKAATVRKVNHKPQMKMKQELELNCDLKFSSLPIKSRTESEWPAQ